MIRNDGRINKVANIQFIIVIAIRSPKNIIGLKLESKNTRNPKIRASEVNNIGREV